MKKSHFNIHDKLKVLQDNGITIYPVIRRNKFLVCVEDKFNSIYKSNKTVGKENHTTKTINDAIQKTINYCFGKFK